MRRLSKEQTKRFLDTPISSFEDYGLDIGAIDQIEKYYGAVYVRDLKGLTPKEMREQRNQLSDLRIGRLQSAMWQLLKEIEEEDES
jgi:hypothetical protein